MKKVLLLIASLLLPLMALYGCGSSGVGSTDTGKIGSTDTGESVSKTGSLTISAKFPQNRGKGEIGAAFIDENTRCISVDIGYDTAYLTPENPTTTFTNIPIGERDISIKTFTGYSGGVCTGSNLDYLYAGATIAEGQNTMVVTLIRANWAFVDGQNPVSITLNKTMTSAQDNVNSFSIIPSEYYWAKKSSIDDTKNWDRSSYPILWKGSNLNTTYNYCPGENTACWGYDVAYYNQFVGPNTNNNAVEDGRLELTPDTNYPDTTGCSDGECGSNRFAFFFGLPLGSDYGYGEKEGPNTITFPDGGDAMPTLNAYETTKVTDSNTMVGNIIEVLLKTETRTETCYDVNGVTTPEGDTNVLITCPWQEVEGSKKAINEAIKKAIMKAMSNRVGKAQVEDCFTNLQWSDSEEWTEYYDLDDDQSWDDPLNVVYTGSGTADVCFHPFTAKASQIPTTDLEIIIQKVKK
jgi:hypothetical protein